MDAQTEWDWWSSTTPWFLSFYFIKCQAPSIVYLLNGNFKSCTVINRSLSAHAFFFGKYPLLKHGLEWPSSYHVTLTTGDWTSGWTLETDTVSLSPGQWPTQLSCLKIWANGHKDHGQSLLGVRLITSCWVQTSLIHATWSSWGCERAETINKQRKLICREDGSNKQLRPQGLSKRTRWSRWLWFLGASQLQTPEACW